MWLRVSLCGLLVVFTLVGEVRPTALITDEVFSALEQEGEALVLIKLKDPADFSKQLRLRKQQIAGIQESVLGRVGISDFEVIYQFEVTCGLAGWLRPSGLEILREDPNVEKVYIDKEGHAHLGQSVPLIGADVVHSMGYSGAGVVVCILDTGVDTDHPNLADGDIVAENCFLDANQNQNCDGNSAEDDNGHGTNVASVITSNGTQGSIGVAPDADIVAIKCLDSGGVFWMSDVVAALDWLNNYADTAQVDIINMSIGTYALYSNAASAESAWPNLTSELNYARNTNGIIPFASSGNNGSSTAISAPAAISSVVSVGAVYDSNIGSYTWSGVCTDNSTAADQVACWSNSCSILDLLAPGCKITTSCLGGGTCWWCGTSQASPHAAGAAALMIECNSSLTPNQIETNLEDYGEDITDSKNGLTFPRINILRTLDRIWISDAAWDDGSIPCRPENWRSPDIDLDPDPPVIGQPCTITATWHNFTSLPQTTIISVEVHDPSVNLGAGQPCLWGVGWYEEVPPEGDQSLEFEWIPAPNSFSEGHYCVIAFVETMDGLDVVHSPYPPNDNNVACRNFHLMEASIDTLTFKAGNPLDEHATLYIHVDRSQFSSLCLAGITYPEDSPISLDPGEWLSPAPQLWVNVPDAINEMVDDTIHVTSTLIPDGSADTLRNGISCRVLHASEIFSEDFNDCDIGDWTVNCSGTGIFETTTEQYVSPPCGLKMVSQDNSRAYGNSPTFDLDTEEDYIVSFRFKVPNADNHWFPVMDNNQIHLVIDFNTDLKTWDGVTAQLVKTLTADQWYLIKCAAHPTAGNYEVYVDDELLSTANFLATEAHTYLTVGDIHDGSTDHGEGFWDDITVLGLEAGASGVEPRDIVPHTYALLQNYPNPFNPVTRIRYNLPEDCRVRLAVYNIIGQRVATLVNGKQTAGYKSVLWNAGSLASGIYFYRLEAGDFVQTRKMVLLR